MKNKNQSVILSVAFLAVSLLLASFSLSANAQTLYSCESSFGSTNPFFHVINPNTGATISTTEIMLSGFTVRGCNGMAKHPVTNACYMIVNVGEPGTPSARILATINPITGEATEIGDTGLAFANIAFDSDGTLYGVTGNGASIPETLFTIDISNGSTTLITALGNGDDGEVIAFNPIDGLLYHGSGNGFPYNDPFGQIFEAINPQTLEITPRTLQGSAVSDEIFEEQSSMVHQTGNVFLTGTIDEIFFSLRADGFVTELGDMDHVSKGLAFDCLIPPRNVPTLSEWGMIAMAGILGIVGFLVIRRRKVTA